MVVKEWRGPVTVAVYIPFPSVSPAARACRDAVIAFIEDNVLPGWPDGVVAPPLTLSFLHAQAAAEDAACGIPTAPVADPVPAADPVPGADPITPKPQPTGLIDDLPVFGGDGDAAGGTVQGFFAGDAAAEAQQARRFGATTVPRHVANQFESARAEAAVRRLAGDGGAGGHRGLAAESKTDENGLPHGHPDATTTAKGARRWSESPGLTPVWRAQPQSKGMLPVVTKKPWREVYDGFYPVNALRNLAWQQVRLALFSPWREVNRGVYPVNALRNLAWQQVRRHFLAQAVNAALPGSRCAMPLCLLACVLQRRHCISTGLASSVRKATRTRSSLPVCVIDLARRQLLALRWRPCRRAGESLRAAALRRCRTASSSSSATRTSCPRGACTPTS